MIKKRVILVLLICCSLIATSCNGSGCQDVESQAQGSNIDVPESITSEQSVFFTITELNADTRKDEGLRTWTATFRKNGTITQFGIQINMVKPKGSFPLSFSEGAFISKHNSDSTYLLRDIGHVLQATKEHAPQKSIDKLAFQLAILGTNATRKDSGSFLSDGKGQWIITKIFVADGQGEFYLNINPKEHIGEISIKDAEYGDIVLTELAKVL